MKRLTSIIEIGDLKFNYVNKVEVNTSYETYTDTAIIKIPNNIKYEGKSIVIGSNSTIFKLGDKVSISLGYDFNYQVVFEGYLAKVNTSNTIELHCEDAMYLFKRATYSKSFKSVNLSDLIDFMLADISSEIKLNITIDVELGKFYIDSATGTQVFEELKDTYGINSFVRDGELFVGLSYSGDVDYAVEKEFVFQNQIISDSLVYKSEEERKVKLKATSINDKNEKIEYTMGDSAGETVEIFAYDLTEDDLKTFAEASIVKNRFSGFEGSFITFGNPLVRHGDKVKLIDLKYPERNGTYIVKSVKTTFGLNGFRQEIFISQKLN